MTEKQKIEQQQTQIIPYFQLFRFATPIDKVCYFFACIAACGNGLLFPFFALIIGGVFNDTGASPSVDETVRKLNQYSLYFLILGIVAFICTFFEATLASISSQRQIKKLREAYVEGLLRQDLAWHDAEKTGDFASRLAEDTISIQAGIGMWRENESLFHSFILVITINPNIV